MRAMSAEAAEEDSPLRIPLLWSLDIKADFSSLLDGSRTPHTKHHPHSHTPHTTSCIYKPHNPMPQDACHMPCMTRHTLYPTLPSTRRPGERAGGQEGRAVRQCAWVAVAQSPGAIRQYEAG